MPTTLESYTIPLPLSTGLEIYTTLLPDSQRGTVAKLAETMANDGRSPKTRGGRPPPIQQIQ